MDKLKAKLRSELAGNPDVSVLDEKVWQLPIVSYDVSFDRVKRFRMDILMKMLLLAFQETDIRRAATLAEMLSVEELFVSDLISKMKRTGLILLGKKGYVLTPKGYDYLEKGIFEESLDREQAIISYSAAHDDYRMAETGSPSPGGELPVYRYAMEKHADTEAMLNLLSEEKETAEEKFQIIVSGIADCEERTADYVPCLEFQLHDHKQDIVYARVWNTMTGSWDETLEKQIEEQEVVTWREAMKKRETSFS
ncbi:hypothetical protein [Planococcus salinus]|uniref:Uncharacterized protein n=1 Tax=Planococcus salinus TaxID=1848460 RepID=A0A3M8P401_9BACL|nr:hypothetical protein [Planococcus salinus]RNF38131.1 hypothetical protein EEX84_16185 [Planococcus salinus]